MRLDRYLKEASYIGNLGFHEMVRFYQIATKEQIKTIERAIKKNDWHLFKLIIKKVLGVELT